MNDSAGPGPDLAGDQLLGELLVPGQQFGQGLADDLRQLRALVARESLSLRRARVVAKGQGLADGELLGEDPPPGQVKVQLAKQRPPQAMVPARARSDST